MSCIRVKDSTARDALRYHAFGLVRAGMPKVETFRRHQTVIVLTAQERTSTKDEQKTSSGQELTSFVSMHREKYEFIAITTNVFDTPRPLAFRKPRKGRPQQSVHGREGSSYEATVILSSDETRTTFGAAIRQASKLAPAPYPSC